MRHVAEPPDKATVVQIGVTPSKNVTVPVGVATPGETGATVAVKVTDWPKTDGLAFEVTLVVESNFWTVSPVCVPLSSMIEATFVPAVPFEVKSEPAVTPLAIACVPGTTVPNAPPLRVVTRPSNTGTGLISVPLELNLTSPESVDVPPTKIGS
ncbi:MAG: hypothetical protein WAT83_01920, partial [Sphingorhabdus sp.]